MSRMTKEEMLEMYGLAKRMRKIQQAAGGKAAGASKRARRSVVAVENGARSEVRVARLRAARGSCPSLARASTSYAPSGTRRS